MKKIIITITTLILLAGCDTGYEGSVKPLSKDGSICLINGNGDVGTLSVVEKTGEISNDVLNLGKWPNDIIEKDGKLYVTNSGNNNVQIIDAGTLESTGSIELSAFSNPMRSAISNRKLYATSWLGTGIDVYDFDKDTLYTIAITGIPAENNNGGTDAVIAYGDLIFAGVRNITYDEFWTPNYGNEYIVVINAEADTVITAFEAGVNIADMLINDENELHVLSTGNRADIAGFVRVFDLSAFNFDTYSTVEIGSQPGSFALNSEGMVYVAVSGLNPDWTGFGGIMKYNSIDNQVLNGAENMVYSSAESGILGICTDGYDKVYASLYGNNELAILESDTVKTVLTTGNGPQGMVFVKE
jgi:YVTN family beta-propeller protein